MIKITKNNWRAFIELTTISEDGDNGVLYFDVTKRPLIIQDKDCTYLEFGDIGTVSVKEKAKDIIKAVDKLIAEEADRKMEEAKKNAEETMQRVLATEKALKGAE